MVLRAVAIAAGHTGRAPVLVTVYPPVREGVGGLGSRAKVSEEEETGRLMHEEQKQLGLEGSVLARCAPHTLSQSTVRRGHARIGVPMPRAYAACALNVYPVRRLLTPDPTLCGKPFELSVDSMHFVGCPVALEDADSHDMRTLSEDAPHDGGSSGAISMFNAFFILEASAEPAEWHSAAESVCAALVYEQKRAGYIAAQVSLLAHIREQMRRQEAERTHLSHDGQVGRIYTCVSEATIRAGASLDTEKLGYVSIGEQLEVLERQERVVDSLSQTTQTRVRFSGGWTSVVSRRGQSTQTLPPVCWRAACVFRQSRWTYKHCVRCSLKHVMHVIACDR